MIHNQLSNVTSYNRYPLIFDEIKKICNSPISILSFGCSTGEECDTLSNLYFPNSNIYGLDINTNIILNNNKKNNNKNIYYVDSIDNLLKLNNKFNIIMAMSVLCRWPEEHGEYSFETFVNTLNIIDKLLDINGYLCIYNSKYIFTDTDIFKNKYIIINTNHTETGFVYKYDKYGNKINRYPYFLFKKIN